MLIQDAILHVLLVLLLLKKQMRRFFLLLLLKEALLLSLILLKKVLLVVLGLEVAEVRAQRRWRDALKPRRSGNEGANLRWR